MCVSWHVLQDIDKHFYLYNQTQHDICFGSSEDVVKILQIPPLSAVPM